MNVLVITVPALSSEVGANTWTTLLEGYDPAHVANICIRNEQPDSLACSRFFRISENKVLKSIYNRRIQTGKEVIPGRCSAEDAADLQAHNARYQKFKKKRRVSMLLARELVWKIGHWKTPELDAFLDDFKPDIILHSMDGYIHMNRLVAYAIKRTGARTIGYIWDDNFTYKQSSSLGNRFYRFFQRRSLRTLAKITDAFFAISPYTKKEADDYFHINSIVLTKPLNALPVAQRYDARTPIRMIYTGNLLIGRDRSLLRLVDALGEINRDQMRIVLDVYTQTILPQDIVAKLERSYSHIHGAISQADVLQKQRETDILLFLEDIDGKDAKAARLSFSTKITDYLSCGKCIFAVGNTDTAPMQHFIENDAALVCDSDESIVSNLRDLCNRSELLFHYAANASETGIRHHHPANIRRIFRETLEEVCKKRSYSARSDN